MTRLSLFAVLAASLFGQSSPVQEPPEEDVALSQRKEYTFNPLQAAKEIRIGNFYFKKSSYTAAARRFEEAVKWDPNSAEAYLRLGDTHAKLGQAKEASSAYRKFLELEPDGKASGEVRKKLR